MKHTILSNLRIPLSFFRMPIFLFACSLAETLDIAAVGVTFVALHFFVYPASYGFEAYTESQEISQLNLELLWTVLFLEISSLFMGLFISWELDLGILVYGFISKIYHHPKISLKKSPFFGLLAVTVFQGAWIVLMVYQAVLGLSFQELGSDTKVWAAAGLAVLWLSVEYLLNRSSQNKEKARLKPFLYALSIFGLLTLGFVAFFLVYYTWLEAVAFLVAILPVWVFLVKWFGQARQDETAINSQNLRKWKLILAIVLNLFFGLMLYFQHF